MTKKTTTTTTVNAFGVVDYNPDGNLNTAFGSGGTVRSLFAGQGAIKATFGGATLEPTGLTGDAKIVLAG